MLSVTYTHHILLLCVFSITCSDSLFSFFVFLFLDFAHVSAKNINTVALGVEFDNFFGSFLQTVPSFLTCFAHTIEDNQSLVVLMRGAVLLWTQKQGCL